MWQPGTTAMVDGKPVIVGLNAYIKKQERAVEDFMMTEQEQHELDAETLKRAMKAFKKRLKLTALDDDSRLGRGPFSGGHTGVYAIQPPDQFPQQVWEELCRQGKLRNSGHGMYQLPKPERDSKGNR